MNRFPANADLKTGVLFAGILMLSLVFTSLAIDIAQHGIFELSFAQSGAYKIPLAEVEASATFSAPSGKKSSIPLFWTEGDTWNVRFSPSEIGEWQWVVESDDAGLNGAKGSFRCTAALKKSLASTAAAIGIRAIKDYPYHFETADGKPFWWMGDTEWHLAQTINNQDWAAAKKYMDVRASQGFNSILFILYADEVPKNEGGNAFVNNQPGQGYWAAVDKRVEYMNSKGMAAGCLVAWHHGWADAGSKMGKENFAKFIAARYSAYNVYFIVAGEYNEASHTDWDRMGQIIADNDPHDRLIGIHPTKTSESFAGKSWCSFGDFQQVYPSGQYDMIKTAHDHNKPVVNAEYGYWIRRISNIDDMRRATYEIVMAGGYFVNGFQSTYRGGTKNNNNFNVDDPKNDIWEEQIQHVKKIMTATDWWKLAPDYSKKLVSGTGDKKYCLYEKGKQYLAYVRGGTNFALSLDGASSQTYSVHQFDPRTGTFTQLDSYTGTGPATLKPPSNKDWLFYLKAGESGPVSAHGNRKAAGVESMKLNLQDGKIGFTSESSVTRVELYNAAGKNVFACENVSSIGNTVDLTTYCTGLYIVRAWSNGVAHSYRFALQR